MFRIAVCDDEKCFRNIMTQYVETYLAKKEVPFGIDAFCSGKELAALGQDIAAYAIVFLDVNMKGLDGIETARKIREYSSDVFIVFVTAYLDYSLEGYKVNAVRYLLKNTVNFEDSIHECMDSIFEKLDDSVLKRKFVFNRCEQDIPLEKICYIESKLHKLEFHMTNGQKHKYTMYGTLNVLEKQLNEFGFLRIHQSYLVNLQHIKKVTGYHAILHSGQMLPIPKAKYRDVKNAFIAYIGEL